MCGIIGYVGNKEANDVLIKGLEKLEYRGYDSAGICTSSDNKIYLHKAKGRVSTIKNKSLPGKIGIGHTRWATHGKPSDENSHPFLDEKEEFAVVHNGIIENYLELKEELRKEGVKFSSATDSEVITHLISKNYDNKEENNNNNNSSSSNDNDNNLREAILKTIKMLQGSYAFCVIKNNNEEIIGARNGSPMVIGLGKGENFLASDVSAIVEYTKDVIYLDDFQICQINKDKVKIFGRDGKEADKKIKKIDWDLEQSQKQGYKHFMLKEIFEQPRVFKDSLSNDFSIEKNFDNKKFDNIVIVGCGTASYAGLVGKYLLEKIAKIRTVNETASEFRYKECLLGKDDLVIVISQSGETADTLAAVRLAKEKGAKTLGLINVVESTIAREVDKVIYTRAGPEIGVASTKAFISQIVTLYKIAFQLAGISGKKIKSSSGKKSEENRFENIFEDEKIFEKIEQALQLNPQIKKIAEKYYRHQNFLYIGRNLQYPLALEGALKLKEISYIHAEAYPAGELKHGPIALVSEEMPTMALCPAGETYSKTISNIEEIRARKGKVICIATEGDKKVSLISDDVIYIPKVEEIFYPLMTIIPLQLFAYHIADLRDCDVDKPRNLAKSVTVE